MHVDCMQDRLHNGREVIHHIPFTGYRFRTWGNVLQPNSLWTLVNAERESQESRVTNVLDITPIITYQICSGNDYPKTTCIVEDLTEKKIASALLHGNGRPTNMNWRKRCESTERLEME